MRHHDVQPMLATLGHPPTSSDFAVEAKYDGQRGIAVIDSSRVTLLSRNGADITNTFPEITAALPSAAPRGPTVLDGEIVALDRDGTPSFSRLQRRWPQNRRPNAELLRAVPVGFFAFDVLRFDGEAALGDPYRERRERLDRLAVNSVIQVPGSWSGVDPSTVLQSTLMIEPAGCAFAVRSVPGSPPPSVGG